MQRTKIVKEVLLEYMQNKGYSYQYDQGTWIFEKQEGKLKQSIFVMDVHHESVKFDFATNVYGQDQVEGINFVNKQKIRINELRCCAYKNEDDFRQIMCEIKRVIVEKGDEIFAEISEPKTEVIPTSELQKQLFENHDELAIQGKNLLNIENKQGREKIEALTKRLEWTRKTKTFQEVKDELVMLSAIYGTICQEVSQGEWIYQNNSCYVINKKNTKIPPLNLIFMAWDREDYRGLNNFYDWIKGTF